MSIVAVDLRQPVLAGRQQVDGIAGSQKHVARRIRQLAPTAGYLHYADMDPGRVDMSLVERLTRALEPRTEILEAYLFGSHARGDAHRQSDVDVAVYIDEARIEAGQFGYQADLTTHLMDALGTNATDIVVLNTAPPLLYHRVLRDGVRLLSRDLRATTTRAGQALSRYFDFLPQMEKMDAARRFAAGKDRR